ncbi:hypothetical protein THAOC_26918, partial [Thalassiosira oceanica]
MFGYSSNLKARNFQLLGGGPQSAHERPETASELLAALGRDPSPAADRRAAAAAAREGWTCSASGSRGRSSAGGAAGAATRT